jgi:hypothetical protein
MSLTEADLERLTGYVRPSAQVRWLRRQGWKFTVNALGKPIVAIAEYNRRMVGGRSVAQQPDFGALNGPHAKAG